MAGWSFQGVPDKGLWGAGIVHEAVQFTTDTTALLSYLPAWFLR
jgi:hypothetical protein